MAVKTIDVPQLGNINFYKRRGVRSIRISLTSSGQVRISLPYWVPYSTALKFVKTKTEWIIEQKTPTATLTEGGKIGKSHYLHFEKQNGLSKPSSRILVTRQVKVSYPGSMAFDSPDVQKVAHAAAVRALKKQAKTHLPNRLKQLADMHGFEYNSVSIKQLKTRWGSCSSKQDIILNCFLMQLPWHLIDYVLLHELNHTNIMAHGTKFWEELDNYVPNLAETRKEIKQYQPILVLN